MEGGEGGNGKECPYINEANNSTKYPETSSFSIMGRRTIEQRRMESFNVRSGLISKKESSGSPRGRKKSGNFLSPAKNMVRRGRRRLRARGKIERASGDRLKPSRDCRSEAIIQRQMRLVLAGGGTSLCPLQTQNGNDECT